MARAHGVRQPVDGDAVHVGLEFRPTLEAVTAHQHQLGVVQSERRAVRVAIVFVHLRGRADLTRKECMQQFLRLPPELIQIRVLAQRARR
jgi:hypothetical protein